MLIADTNLQVLTQLTTHSSEPSSPTSPIISLDGLDTPDTTLGTKATHTPPSDSMATTILTQGQIMLGISISTSHKLGFSFAVRICILIELIYKWDNINGIIRFHSKIALVPIKFFGKNKRGWVVWGWF